MAITYDENLKTFYLETKNSSYAFKVMKNGLLQHLYYGKKISRDDLSHIVDLTEKNSIVLHEDLDFSNPLTRFNQVNQYQLEYPSLSGRGDFKESAIIINSNNDSRLSDYKFDSFKIHRTKPKADGLPTLRDGETLEIKLKDDSNNTSVSLFYSVYSKEDAIAKRVEIKNESKDNINIERAFSSCLELNGTNWETISLPGAWINERNTQERRPVSHGVFTIESRRGISSAQMNPGLIMVRPSTTEDYGEAIGLNLIYSGSFAFKVESEENDNVRVVGGINDFDFSWTLKPNQKFTTPEVAMVYSSEGLGKMSRCFHDLYREHLINPNYVKKQRPIIINNWEATNVNFNEEKIISFIDSVKDTGITTFVLDDGWFGHRNDDYSSLGDWFVDKNKLPNGLKPIIDHCHACGLEFGLWIEPEMINEDSVLFTKHPDWMIHAPKIKPSYSRNQYVLDLTREDVCEYIINTINNLLDENEISYIKWDMNRSLTENYSSSLENKKETQHRYILGLYKVMNEVMSKHPNVFFEGCAAGGARFDAGMLAYFPQIWESDNSDAYSRMKSQYNTSLFYPMSAQDCHVTAVPNHQTGRVTPFNSRERVAQLGAFGYELDPTSLSEQDKSEVVEQINRYHNQTEALVLDGDVYRLSNIETTGIGAMELISKEKDNAHIVAMKGLNKGITGPTTRIYPRGLIEKALYQVTHNTNPAVSFNANGDTIMNAGLLWPIDFREYGDFTSTTYTIKLVNKLKAKLEQNKKLEL